MPASQAVWGIDIGQCALKALKLHQSESGLLVEQFEVIEHANVLSQPDADVPELIRASLEEFLRRQDVSDATVCVSVLGQSSFTRFVKLPPVEQKRIPEIVRFEAEQQIPFPIDEVTWRYQTFRDADSPEIEAGIFAMKKVDIAEMLSYFQMTELDVDVVQMAPLALYNMMDFDGQRADDGATLLADVGADKTHLVVADGSRVWTRTVQIGGNRFTEALCKSFKLNFAKAEKLKRTAAQSKYARQIFQVMRPVFADLVQEIQRSIGYYTSLNRESRFKRLVGMGNGFRLPGMQKYLEQNLNMPVARTKGFNKVSSNFEHFQDNALSFGVAYGLAIQGLGLAPIQTNLLPEQILKQRLWGKKKPWFAAAAAALIIAGGAYLMAQKRDQGTLESTEARQKQTDAELIVQRLKGFQDEQKKYTVSSEKEENDIKANLAYRAYVGVWPEINSRIAQAVRNRMLLSKDRMALESIPRTEPSEWPKLIGQISSDQARLTVLGMLPDTPRSEEAPDTPTLRETVLAQLKQRSRGERRIVILESQASEYVPDLDADAATATSDRDGRTSGVPMDEMMGPPTGRPSRTSSRKSTSSSREKEKRRGFRITIAGRTPLTRGMAVQLVGELKTALKESLDASDMLDVVGEVETAYPGNDTVAPGGGGRMPGRGVIQPPMLERGGRAAATADAGPTNPDPLFPDESLDGDVRFELTVRLAVVGNGLAEPEIKVPSTK